MPRGAIHGSQVAVHGSQQVRIDSSAGVDAFSKLADTSGAVSTEVAVAITRQVMDATDGAMLQLLSSLEPHLGQQVDLSL